MPEGKTFGECHPIDLVHVCGELLWMEEITANEAGLRLCAVYCRDCHVDFLLVY